MDAGGTKNGGALYDVFETAWGWFGAVAGEKGLIAAFLPRAKGATLKSIKLRFPGAKPERGAFTDLRRDVQAYFEGRPVRFDVPLDFSTFAPFQALVLDACHRIPYGRTSSYAQLARAVGHPKAARAVGGTMAHNPLPLVVPCHRVLRSDGRLGGFSSPGGLDEKLRMLGLEGSRPQSAMNAVR
jgi:methylated-DNA-[protein]-cysteine S-methyltransferase